MNVAQNRAAQAGWPGARLAATKPSNLATVACNRCGAPEVRAILNRSESVCGHCIDSMAQLAARSQAVLRTLALDMTPSIECVV
jgi:hypothetical protein